MKRTIVKGRGAIWFDLLTKGFTVKKGLCPSVLVADGEMNGIPMRAIAVVADVKNHYPRAKNGEVGLLEGWTLGQVISEAVKEDRRKKVKRVILAIIDVPSQAYGRREEAFGIHLALSAAAGAYANARQLGHPVIGLIVGKAMSGAFLAHGYQANRLIALNDQGVMVHAMGKASAARITLRTIDALEELASTIPPMAYDIKNYHTLGLLEELIDIKNPEKPTKDEIAHVLESVQKAIKETLKSGVDLKNRLGSPNRKSTSLVYEKMREQWTQ